MPFFDTKISNLLCEHRNSYSSDHTLTRVTEKTRKTLDSKGVVGIISMDLSKAFDSMPHDLLITKLNASYLGNKEPKVNCELLLKQEIKIGNGHFLQQLAASKGWCT